MRILADIIPLRTSADYRRLWIGNTVSWTGRAMTALQVPGDRVGRLQGVFIVVVAGGPRLGDLLAVRWRHFVRYDARAPVAQECCFRGRITSGVGVSPARRRGGGAGR
ncbi:hypothetical protein [Streptomyces sp. N35]|uniref:hypothetical protein n=1 Tax=Streptomyces sp. N35 TaxID=2795730 RepID=UPI0035AB91F8